MTGADSEMTRATETKPVPLDDAALDAVTGGTSFSAFMLNGAVENGNPGASEHWQGWHDAETNWGQGGDDTLEGLGGNDTLRGNQGDDLLDGGDGQDKLYGGLGSDALSGGDGHDRLEGEAGDDFISGDEGNDTANGGIGNDEISGGAGNDRLDGEIGNDTLWGDAGRDTLVGGWGSDTFVIDGRDAGQDSVAGHNESAVGEWLARHDTDTIELQNVDWSEIRIEFKAGGFSGGVGPDGMQQLRTNSAGTIWFGDQRVDFRGIEQIKVLPQG
jgi:Ca2+-binding RTX toxin-like protein